MSDKSRLLELRALSLEAIGLRYGFTFDKVGDKLRALCRFHGDSGTPNLFAYPDDTFFCFACRRGGSKSAFVAYAEGMDKAEVEQLWEDVAPIEETLAKKLEPEPANYKEHLQLAISRAFFESRKRCPGIPVEVLGPMDRLLSGKKFVSLAEYSSEFYAFRRLLGGYDGQPDDKSAV